MRLLYSGEISGVGLTETFFTCTSDRHYFDVRVSINLV